MFYQFPLGIEVKFQIVELVTCEMRSYVSEILNEGQTLLGEKLKPELIQSMIKIGTEICQNTQEGNN